MVTELGAGRVPVTPWVDEEDAEFDRLLAASSAGKAVAGEPGGSAPGPAVSRLQQRIFAGLAASVLTPQVDMAVLAPTEAEEVRPVATAGLRFVAEARSEAGAASGRGALAVDVEHRRRLTARASRTAPSGDQGGFGSALRAARQEGGLALSALFARFEVAPDTLAMWDLDTLARWELGCSGQPRRERFAAFERTVGAAAGSLLAWLPETGRRGADPPGATWERLLGERGWSGNLWAGNAGSTVPPASGPAGSRRSAEVVGFLLLVEGAGGPVDLGAVRSGAATQGDVRHQLGPESSVSRAAGPGGVLAPVFESGNDLEGGSVDSHLCRHGRLPRGRHAVSDVAMDVFMLWWDCANLHSFRDLGLGVVPWSAPEERQLRPRFKRVTAHGVRVDGRNRLIDAMKEGTPVGGSCRCDSGPVVRLRRQDDVFIVDRAHAEEFASHLGAVKECVCGGVSPHERGWSLSDGARQIEGIRDLGSVAARSGSYRDPRFDCVLTVRADSSPAGAGSRGSSWQDSLWSASERLRLVSDEPSPPGGTIPLAEDTSQVVSRLAQLLRDNPMLASSWSREAPGGDTPMETSVPGRRPSGRPGVLGQVPDRRDVGRGAPAR